MTDRQTILQHIEQHATNAGYRAVTCEDSINVARLWLEILKHTEAEEAEILHKYEQIRANGHI